MINNYKTDEAKTNFSWTNFKRILKYINPYKKRIFITVLLSIISSLLLLVIPQIIAYAIDEAFPNNNKTLIVILSLVTLICVILSTFLGKIKDNQLSIVLNKVGYDLKIELFQKLQTLPNNYFDTKAHGKIYTRVASYPDEVSIIICFILVNVALDFLSLIFASIFMLFLNAKLALISIIPAILLMLILGLLSPIRRKLKHKANDKRANVNAFLTESINGIHITWSFNREEENTNILRKLEKEHIDSQYRTLFIGNLNWSLSGACNYITMALIYFIGLKYMYPALSIGVIVALTTYSTKFWSPIEYLSSNLNSIMDASTYLERIFELLDEPVVIEEKKNALTELKEGNIEFKDVSFGYNEEIPVLKNVNLNIPAGSKVGLVGKTGCGKSTILNLISRFYDINKGEILIDKENIKNYKLSTLRGNISMMLQDNYLFSRSIYENLTLGANIPLKEVRKICKLLDIDEMILSYEKGYDTILLNNASNISSGERQLLCIARIMIQNPKILILDEATSNIDLKTEKKITKALELVMKNRTTILVAHRLSTVKNCDKIVLIKNGQIKEEGTHQELMKKQGEYYNLYQKQNK